MRKALFLVVVALFLVSGAALAQDEMPVLCGDLSEADCAILEQSQAAMEAVTAAAFDGAIDVTAEAEDESFALNITVSGAYSGVPQMGDMEAMDPLPDMDAVLDALRAVNAELVITFNLPEDMAEDMHAPTSLGLELRFVDGVGYINFDALGDVVRDMELSGWGGLDIASLIGALMEQVTPEMLEQMSEGMMEGMPLTMMGGMDASMLMMEQFSDPEFLEQYVTITRVDDGSGTVAVFETTFDFAAFFADPAFTDMMREQIVGMAEMQGEEVPEEDLDMALSMMSQMWQDMTMVVTEEIDTTTGLLQAMSFSMSMDMSAAMAMSGEDEGTAMFSVNVAFSFDYENVPVVEAPADANILPYEEVLEMIGFMMMGMEDMMPMMTPEAQSGG